MDNTKNISENAFHTLSASPLDSRKTLMAKADEAMLLGEDNAEAALGQLLHPQKRLEAEIHWFPGAQTDEAEALLDWRAKGREAPFPPLHSDSLQAQFNACRLLMERWPVADFDSAVALCRAIAPLDAAIDPESTLREINADRERSGFQPVPEADAVAWIQDELRRRVASDLMARLDSVPRHLDLMLAIAGLYRETSSPLMETLVDIDALNVSEKASALRDKINDMALRTATRITTPESDRGQVEQIQALLTQWNTLTLPNRKKQQAKGLETQEAKQLFICTRNMFVRMWNDKRMYAEGEMLVTFLMGIFAELPSAMNQFNQDIAFVHQVLGHAGAAPAKKDNAPPPVSRLLFLYGGLGYSTQNNQSVQFVGGYVNPALLPANREKCIQFVMRSTQGQSAKYRVELRAPDGMTTAWENTECSPNATIQLMALYRPHAADFKSGTYTVTCNGATLATFELFIAPGEEGARFLEPGSEISFQACGVGFRIGQSDLELVRAANYLTRNDQNHREYAICVQLRGRGNKVTRRPEIRCEATGEMIYSPAQPEDFSSMTQRQFLIYRKLDEIAGDYLFLLDGIPAYRFSIGLEP